MTSRTSLFNKGIYKSTLKRYIWGSVLYAILLFMTTSMVLMFDVDIERSVYRTMEETGVSLLLEDVYLFLPLVMAFFVPTVAALLVFRFVHSKKTAIFVHSLPVSRTANYISSVLAALTLMVVPIILNGLILVIMSCTAYGDFFNVSSCFVWMGMNLLTIFLMFSASSFVAMLTGNSFALVGLNGLFHGFAIVIAACFSALSGVFLYGYYDANELIMASMDWNFVHYVMELANDLGSTLKNTFELSKLIIMLIIALVLYAAGWLLYKKRRMETAEEVAAFRCLNPIYKYLVTFIVALASFGLFGHLMDEKPMLPVVVAVIVSIIAYFAGEMILKKSFRIWKSWKGYVGFAAVFSGMICVFAFTGFFGYETRVPDSKDVESVAIYEYYYQEDVPWLSNAEIIDYAIGVHEEMVVRDDIYTVQKYIEEYNSGLHIRYKLKNGNMIVRRYPITQKRICQVMDDLYKSQEYKMSVLELFTADIGRINAITLNYGNETIRDEAMIELVVAALKKDLLALDYTQMYSSDVWSMGVNVEYVPKKEIGKEGDNYSIYSAHQTINANFKNTLQWIIDKTNFNSGNKDLCIIPVEQWNSFREAKEEVETPTGITEKVRVYKNPTIVDFPGVVRITDQAQKDAIRSYVITTGVRFVPDKDYAYYVFTINDDDSLDRVAAFYEENKEILDFAR